MAEQSRQEILKELSDLRSRVVQLEQHLAEPEQRKVWRATEYYAAYYATTGFMLGLFGGATSLLFNVVGSLIVGQHPLQLIKVYLTFPLGEKAISPDFDSGMTLAVGCCLYLSTGMLLGIPFQMLLARYAEQSFAKRLVFASIFGIAIWLINYYAILSWLQPLLFGGNWIVNEIPPWVAMLTHLVFGWTMAIVYPLGAYQPYRLQTEH